jgi:hypothetical protein
MLNQSVPPQNGGVAMRPDIELARQRLQTILCELEQCCAEEEAFSPRLVREAHTLVRLLHEEGYNMATIMRNNEILVEIEPMPVERLAA